MKSVHLVTAAVLVFAVLLVPRAAVLYAQTPALPVPGDDNGPDAGDDDQTDAAAAAPPADGPQPAEVQGEGAEAPGGEEGMQVLARGPVNEAFADPVTFEPRESELIERAPPQPIQEQPPDVRPDGDPIWIPGYWAWDDERKDYIWVSGAWRVPPGGQRWVPGYWAEVSGGYKWVSGFWTAEQAQEVNYLPQPPASQERGPNTPTPGEDYFWVPGNWYYQQSNYVWTPGYWTRVQPSWMWMPARYYWTPTGYVFVRGYWDYPIVRRGWLFAPVYFAPGFYARPGFYYSPTAVVDVGALSVQLFVRPRWGCYYFGDYYGPRYAGIGFYPWFRWGGVGIGYDPIFTYQRWYYRHHGDERWEHHIQEDFARRDRDPHARPPHLMQGGEHVAGHLAMPLNQYVAKKDVQKHVERLNANQRDQFAKSAHEMRNFQGQRQKLELKNAAIAGPSGAQAQNLGGRATLKLPNSGITGSARDKLGGQGGLGRSAGTQGLGASQFGSGAVNNLNKGSAIPGARQTLNKGQFGPSGVENFNKAQAGPSGAQNLSPGPLGAGNNRPRVNAPNFNAPVGGGNPQGKGGPANRIERKENRKPGSGERHGSNDQPVVPGANRAFGEVDRTPRGLSIGPQGSGVRRETLRPVDPSLGGRGGGASGGAQPFQRPTAGPPPKFNPAGGAGSGPGLGKAPANQGGPTDSGARNRDKNRPN